MLRRLGIGVLLGGMLAASAAAAKPPVQPMALRVDATDTPHQRTRVHLTIPAEPGPLTLLYPSWIPGTHASTGPLVRVANLALSAAGRPLAWERDGLDPFAFHCTVPADARAVEADFLYLSPPGRSEAMEVSVGVSASRELAVLNWSALLLYPQGRPVESQLCEASLRLPAGWEHGSALPLAGADGDTLRFSPVSLVKLVDSPVIAGAHFRTIPLDVRGTPHQLDVACDTEAGLAANPAALASIGRMVAESGALFQAQHFTRFHFLIGLSNRIPSYGLEHQACSVNTAPERALADPPAPGFFPYLLTHEFLHSWCGKHRRPAGMVTADFQQPQRTDLLWVYEGLTQYLSELLEVRAGLKPSEAFRAELARVAGELALRPGRSWQSLADSAVAYPFYVDRSAGWTAYRRDSNDVYYEAELVWLEADALIRQRSSGRRSLDDFCRRFLGGPPEPDVVRPFTFEDVVAALNAVQPYDWRAFWTARLHATGPGVPLGGIEAAGWRLAYSDEPRAPSRTGAVDLRYSLGLRLTTDGTVSEVVPEMAAQRAGVEPGMRITGINGERLSAASAHAALQRAREPAVPVELLVEDGEQFRTLRVEYHEGDRHPVLERDPTRPDLLEPMGKPLAASSPET
jgi:predicted metalloprotease with PDZ domain